MTDENSTPPPEPPKNVPPVFWITIERNGESLKEFSNVTQFMLAMFDGQDYKTFCPVYIPEIASYMTDMLKVEKCIAPLSGKMHVARSPVLAPKKGLFLPPGVR